MTSCIDYEEELTIHKDLSGEALLTITLPDALLPKYASVQSAFSQEAITKKFDAMSGVKLEYFSKSTDRKPVIKMRVSFSSLEKLNDAIAANPPASLLGGQFTITKEEGKTRIVRKLGQGQELNDLPQSNNVQYKIHFDGTIASTNSGFYNQMASDVRYRWTLAELLAQKPEQVNVLTKSLPWMWILVSIAVVGGAAYYGWKLTGKKRVLVNPAPLYPAPGAAPAPPAGQVPPPAAPPSAPPQAPPPAGGPPRPSRPGPPQPRRPGGPPQG